MQWTDKDIEIVPGKSYVDLILKFYGQYKKKFGNQS